MSETAKRAMPPDEFEELARQLRQGGAGREMRAEAQEDEELTELRRRRHQHLADVARTALHRGDRVTVTAGGLTLTHPIVAVGADYVSLQSEDALIDVSLEVAVVTVEPRPAGGMRAGTPGSATFRARLAEHEGQRALVVTIEGRQIDGRLEVAATDHIAVTDDAGVTSYVPVTVVAALITRIPPRRG